MCSYCTEIFQNFKLQTHPRKLYKIDFPLEALKIVPKIGIKLYSYLIIFTEIIIYYKSVKLCKLTRTNSRLKQIEFYSQCCTNADCTPAVPAPADGSSNLSEVNIVVNN